MPANEQTWRDTKLLHKLFGVTSALMLLATIWMFAADHTREWKPIQRTANRAEMTLTDWRKLQFATDENERQRSELTARLEAARRQPVPQDLLAEFKAEAQRGEEASNISFEEIDELAAEVEANAGKPEAEEPRRELIESLRGIVRDVRFREDSLLGERKFTSADRDAAVAALGLLVRDNRGADGEQQEKQEEIDRLKEQLDALSASYDRTKEQRVKLEDTVRQITADEDKAVEDLAANEAELKQLDDANAQRQSTYINWYGYVPLPGKRFLELPIFDAFNSPRKIDNLWSNGNTIDYNFSRVRRFDRCTTCHQMIQKTLPGSAVDAAYEHDYLVSFRVVPAGSEGSADGATPAAESIPPENEGLADQLNRLLGVKIAAEGLISRNDATIQLVRPQSPASTARAINLDREAILRSGDELRLGLLETPSPIPVDEQSPGLVVGDVVVAVNETPAMHANKVASTLLDAAMDGRPFTVTVRRGMPNPYTSHPRLDLFVGSLSPHKMSEFACTICHDGQGSATAFKWAGHSPNSTRQRRDWMHEHGWFDNPHWIFPMYPKRFTESACLKCHHDVTELEPSERFPVAPAPKVVHGFHLIRKYGCYGCHEINGYDGKRSIGPDLRLEPNFFAAAQQLQVDPKFNELPAEQRDWVQELIDHPENTHTRRRLLEFLELDAKAETPTLSAESHGKLTPLFRDVESPGKLRKAGPSLRYAAHKLDPVFLADWIREPKNFRPNTRMPQFFGLWNHLQGGNGVADAKQFEPLEILGIVTYLQKRTQPFDYLEPPAEITQQADVGRGRTLFQTRGCLACHTHKSFADADAFRGEGEIVQGPDLSGVADKFVGENQRKWLYSWIKNPTKYHPRTMMPNLFLDPIEGADGQVSDPAADIVAFLVEDSKVGWQPRPDTLTKVEDVAPENLDRFVAINLAETFASHRADEYTKTGVPESLRAELKGPEVELVVPAAEQSSAGFKLSTEQKLLYIGRKSIGKYGCYGCHDVPGFEDAKPIGTTLADWGRKDSARLAFEHISQYLGHGHGHAAEHEGSVVLPGSQEVPPGPAGDPTHSGDSQTSTQPSDSSHVAGGEHGAAAEGTAHVPRIHAAIADESDEDWQFFLGYINSGHRAGFIYQKLREPRSYDYHKTENKRYNERLRMPEFPFDAEDREAVVTFILGLVADPPADKYLFRPTDQVQAILKGRQVLEKYNCGGCHILSPEKWQVAMDQSRVSEQPPVKTYPFVKTHFTPGELALSARQDRSGRVRATLSGMPTVDDTGVPLVYDDEGEPVDGESKYDASKVELPFDLWEPTAVGGFPYDIGVLPVNVLATDLSHPANSDGGMLAKYLLRHVVALEKQSNPAAKGTEAWGWLPPPLMGEGEKVQTDWLHSFLLNPYPIRPATFLRMPRFNMSSEEAADLVNYFAAMDGVEYPYAFDSRRQSEHLTAEESRYREMLAQTAGQSGAPTTAPADTSAQPPADPPPANQPPVDQPQAVQPPPAALPEGQGAGGQSPAATAPAVPPADERNRFDDAMRLVVNNNYCVKCHLVDDFVPTGSERAKAPNLAMVYRRLRPDYLRRWIANPKSILPYTSMPINIPYEPEAPNLGGVSQDLYHGTSVEQVDALVDLLMNYDRYAKERNSVNSLVQQYGGPPPQDAAPGAAPPSTTAPPSEPSSGTE